MEQSIRNKLIASHFLLHYVLLILAVLILFPFPLFTISSHYEVPSVLFSILFIPPLFFSTLFLTEYFRDKFTLWVWIIRILAIIQLIIASTYMQITKLNALALFGFLFFTFFYEIGYCFSKRDAWEILLKKCIWVMLIISIYILPFIIHKILKGGFLNFLSSATDIQVYLPVWPNYFGIYLVITFWLIIYFSRSDKKYLLLLIIILPLIFLTFSRTAIGSLMLTMGIWGLKLKSRKKLFFICVFFPLFISSFMVFKTRNKLPGSALEYGVADRIWLAKSSISKWKEHPIIGYGFKSFIEIVPEYCYDPLEGRMVGSSHNDYVDLLVRGGILYSLIFWGFVMFLIIKGFKLNSRNKHENISFVSLAILVMVFSAFVQNPFKNPVTLTYFWYFAGVISFLNQKKVPS